MRRWPCRILQDRALWLTPVWIDPRLKVPEHRVRGRYQHREVRDQIRSASNRSDPPMGHSEDGP
eukprot:2270369-Pyramimonas_sp.AAC.1